MKTVTTDDATHHSQRFSKGGIATTQRRRTDAEVLLERLRERGVVLTVELAKRMRRFDWTTDLRYETGRKDTGETAGLLRTAKAMYDWAQSQIR